jgi:hypothetical protein
VSINLLPRRTERCVIAGTVAAVAIGVGVVGCGGGHSTAPETTAAQRTTQARTTTSTAAPAPPRPRLAWAVIVNINPFGDACAGPGFRHVAVELKTQLADAGVSSRIVRSSAYPNAATSDQFCVETARYPTEKQARGRVAKLAHTGNGFTAQVFEVTGPTHPSLSAQDQHAIYAVLTNYEHAISSRDAVRACLFMSSQAKVAIGTLCQRTLADKLTPLTSAEVAALGAGRLSGLRATRTSEARGTLSFPAGSGLATRTQRFRRENGRWLVDGSTL